MTEDNSHPTSSSEKTPWGFVVCMALVACGALAGQSSSLFSLVGFNSERSRWDAKGEFRDRLVEEVAQLEDKVIEARANTDGALAERQGAESLLAALQAEHNSARSRLLETQNAEAQASASASQFLAEAEVSRKEMASKKAERSSLFNEIQQSTTRLADLKADITQQEGTKTRLDEGVANRREQEESVRQALSSAQSALITANTELAEVQPELKEAKDNIAEGLALASSLRNKRLQESGLQVEVQSLTDQRDSLVSLISTLKNDRAALREGNGLLRTTEQGLTKSNTALEKEVARLDAEIAAGRPQAAALQISLAELQTKQADLQKRLLGLESSRTERIQLDAEVKAFTATRERLSAEVLQLEKSSSALRASLSLLQEGQVSLEANLRALRSEEATLQVEVRAIEGLQASRNALSAEVQRLAQEKKTLNQQITDSLSENQKSLTSYMAQLIEVIGKAAKSAETQPKGDSPEDEGKQ